MKIHAYVLAGDPAWIGEAIGSFYGLVDRIVVSYDADGLSWSGHPLSTADPGAFLAAIETAAGRAASAVEYPARVLYARARSGRFLETCGRFWSTQSSYPGPVAVRAGTTLSHARQAAGVPVYRVDVAPWNTDPARPATTPVHRVIRRDQAILHLSWVRSEDQMAEKRTVSGHARDRDWDGELGRWRRRMRHPFLTAAAAPFARKPFERYRVTSLPAFARLDP